MQAIVTKYHGPTDRKGARISATSASSIRLYLSYDHSLDLEENHDAAALALARKLAWTRWPYSRGSLRNGYVYVPVPTVSVALSAIENLDMEAWERCPDAEAYRDLRGVPSLAEAATRLHEDFLRA